MSNPFVLRRNKALLVFGAIQGVIALQFYVPISAIFLTSRGLDYQDIFILEAVLLLSIMATEVPSGYIADRIDRKWALLLGFSVAAVGDVLFAVGGGMWVYVVSFALSGLSIAILSGADSAYVYESLGDDADEHATAAFGRLSAIELVAGVVGGLVGPFVGAMTDIAVPAYATAGAAVVGALLAFALPSRPPQPEDEEGGSSSLSSTFKLIVRHPVLLYAAFASGTGYVVFNAVYTINQPLFDAATIPVAAFGAIAAGAMLVAAFANNSLGKVEKRVGSGNLLGLATIGGGVGFVVLAVPNPAAAVVGFLIVIVGMNLRGPVIGAMTNRLIDDSRRATALSLMSTIGSIAGIGVNIAFGAVVEHSQTYAAWTAAGLLVLFGLVWIPIARRYLPKSGDEDADDSTDEPELAPSGEAR